MYSKARFTCICRVRHSVGLDLVILVTISSSVCSSSRILENVPAHNRRESSLFTDASSSQLPLLALLDDNDPITTDQCLSISQRSVVG